MNNPIWTVNTKNGVTHFATLAAAHLAALRHRTTVMQGGKPVTVTREWIGTERVLTARWAA